ncbi:MAG: hypothetical protein ACK56U_16085 [Planctomyces sp.]
MRRGVLRSVRLMLLAILCLSVSGGMACGQPRVGMKLELGSIRGRTASPIHVNVRLEYNEPQFLEGYLELQIYDALELTSESDRLATLRRDGIVLAGQDYEFSLLLPPLQTSDARNWAVRAWFVTKDERIELTSAPGRKGPAEPFDLLMTSSLERAFVMCSASEDPRNRPAAGNRKLLQERLLLSDVMNGLQSISGEQLEGEVVELRGSSAGADGQQSTPGIVHYAAEWDVKTLSEDPLAYCAFDVLLLSDGALGLLSEAQQRAIEVWVRGGGSVVVEARERLQPQQLGFLRLLMAQGLGAESDLALDDEGRLLVVADRSGEPVLSRAGLGRAVLLPVVDDLTGVVQRAAEWRRTVCFLWKVREYSDVYDGTTSQPPSDLELARRYIRDAQRDERGIYSTNAWAETENGQYVNLERSDVASGRFYVPERQLLVWRRQWQARQQSLRSQQTPLLGAAEAVLLPADVQMVPVSVIAVILLGYVLVVGPVDYFVLGWLRMRKYTWLLFPVVTAVFTFLTIAVAHAYMSSDDTGGVLLITDIDEGGGVVRQTTLETLFYGGGREVTLPQRRSLLVQTRDQYLNRGMYGDSPMPSDEAPIYEGVFPQNFGLRQSVQQWSPVSFRSLTLEPEGVELPAIDWEDSSLVTTEEGRLRLRASLQMLSQQTGGEYEATVVHQGGLLPVVTQQVNVWDGAANGQYRERSQVQQFSWASELLGHLSGQQPPGEGVFSLVSQLSPQGSDALEDLAMSSADNPEEYVLVVMRRRGERIEVLRRLYRVAGAAQ